MHKKPLVAVLLFGLLLVLPFGVTEARVDPGQYLTTGAQPLPWVARGIDKEVTESPTQITGSPTTMNMGVSRTAATYCDGQWQGAPTYFLGGWFLGDEFYAAYQDPAELGTCAGLDDIYTFDVTATVWAMFDQVGGGVYHAQPIVWENAGDLACPVPGDILCAGPLYEITLPAGGFYFLTLPFDTECCVFDPYFAGLYFADFLGADVVDLISDAGPGVACQVYNEYGFGWDDMYNYYDLNVVLFSEGNAYDQNNCPGAPGICDFQSWYSGIAFFWQAPNANGQNDYFTRFTGDVSCTLQVFSFQAYCGGLVGTPTFRVSVFGTNGPVFGGRMYPQAFGVPFDALDPNHLESIDLPDGSYNCYPTWTDVDVTDVPFGPGQDVIVSVALSENTPDPVNDVVSILSDDGAIPTARSGSWVGALGDWYYNDEVFATPRNWVMEAYICCEEVEAEEVACSAPGPDDWNTFAHDYQRTSATSIEVGDPCQINPVWFADQQFAINFTQATVAEDRVYISNDQRARVYDLATGALINTVSGLPYVFGSNRGNMTIEGSAVYMTGGTGQSLSRWDLDLSADVWVNGVGGDNPPLGANVRFGGATVVTVGPDEIVLIGSENARLWAFLTSDGTLYPGWATNPLILDANVLHGVSYDGTNLFAGTADAGFANGSIYSIDPATGAINWNVAYNGDGFPAGVGIDGDHIYASSSGLGLDGYRYKIDKTDGSVVWAFQQERSLYGTPAIGRNFIYCNLDGTNGGLTAIDKNIGAPVYNFASDGVGAIPQHVTITCDNYMFAGDRNGQWWLLDLVNFVPAWQIEVPYFSAVMGTAVSSNVAGDKNYAILSLQSGGPTAGMISAYEFNSGPRPIVAQHTFETNIGVEFGTGAGIPYTEPGVFSNLGCADLNFTAYNLTDPAPDVVSSSFLNTQSQYAAALANRSVDASFNAYFETGKLNKSQQRLFEAVDSENYRYDQIRNEAVDAMKSSNRNNTRMAAGSAFLRTSNVAATNPLPAGSSTDVDWDYDGTNLQRGVDVEVIEFVTDDPDRLLYGNQPLLQITYAGGCFPATAAIEWNTLDVTRFELMYNDGQLGDDDEADDLDWDGTASQDLYDGNFYLAGEVDNVAVPPIAQYFEGAVYNNETDLLPLFLPDPFPGPDCEFQGADDVLMGYKREGGCPGTPTEIYGSWLRTAFVDTNIARVGTFGEAIGTRIEATEIGAYDPLYGDFKLMHYEVTNRDAVDKGPIYAGSYIDWDVRPNYATNTGFLGLSYNGYGIYDHNAPELAFGMFDPNLPTAYGGVDPTFNRPQRINPMGESVDGVTGSGSGAYDGPWQAGRDADPWEELHEYTVNRLPQFEDGPQDLVSDPSPYEDHAGLITLKGQILPANGTIEFNQAIYAVDATSADENTMEALGLALAQRASKWAGFARGDVNDDNTVNLLDVCWLLSGNQIYPDTYCGDVDLSGGVDAADEAYLLNYVTGLGPAPQGEWRFTF